MSVNQSASSAFDFDVSVQNASEMEGKFLTFWTDGQLFGVPIADVVQIVGVQEITVIPEYPNFAKGVINLRGSIIPVIDVRLRLNKPEQAYNERTCIIVTNINGTLIGFIVDAVNEVTDIEDKAISEPPRVAGSSAGEYLTGIAKTVSGVILLIDTKQLLGEQEIINLTQTGEI